MNTWKRLTMRTFAIMQITAFPAYAAIDYNEKENAIWVTDYQESQPCTLNRLLTVDNSFEWKKVAYDENTKTYTINCNLWIGSNNNTNTFFQIGTTENPTEKLIIKGSVVVKPYWVKGENPGAAWWNTRMEKYTNRLTIGNPNDKNITSELLIYNEKDGVNGITAGSREQTKAYGGQLHVYNSKISAAVQNKDQAIANIMIDADSIVFDNATVSWSKSNLAYGINSKNSIVKNTVFENGSCALYCGKEYVRGCTFRNCNIAVFDSGSMDALLVDCKFENNICNWNLSYTDKGLTLIDCEIGKPTKGNLIKSWNNKTTGKENCPFVAIKKHLMLNVVDGNNNPIKNASVKIKSAQNNERPDDITTSITDGKGMTPAKEEKGSLLVTESFEKATASAVEKTSYTYTIEVSAAGFETRIISDYRPEKNGDVIKVSLK